MKRKKAGGFSLLESIFTIGIIVIIAEVVYTWALLSQRGAFEASARTLGASIATEQIELLRNVPYDQVGTISGNPAGNFPQTQTVVWGGINFSVSLAIDYVDDPYDGDALGTIPAKPVDTVPADYKRIEVRVCWKADCPTPVQLTSTVAPDGVESASNTGSLFIEVQDADGLPVSLVDVTVTNATTGPPVNIVNRTDVEGRLQLLSLPPATNTYHVEVSKAGYTSDSTLVPTPQNPNPKNPDTTIVVGGVTQLVFFIDQVSTLTVITERSGACEPVGNIQLTMTGQRLIGTAPDVPRIVTTITTDASGQVTLPNFEWDDYAVSMDTPGYDVAGTDPPSAFIVAPGTAPTWRVKLADHTDHSLWVTVLDSGTKVPLSDAIVHLTGPGFDETQTTNQGALVQTDWSGGPGQAAIGDETRYDSASGAIDDQSAGQLRLARQDQSFTASETFATTDFRDSGVTTADWTTGSPGSVQLPEDSFNPGQYQTAAAAQSLKLNPADGLLLDVELTASETLNGETIQYSVAADGVTFEAVTPGTPHSFAAAGTDLRWRAVLSTANTAVTPVLNGVTLQYTQRVLTGTSGSLTSSTFDTGAVSNFTTLRWTPDPQPPSTGPSGLRLQLATNDDQLIWNYFGPDGTAGTYFTASDTPLPAAFNNHRYLRYQVSLATDDPTVSPTLGDLAILHSNSCFAPGQVAFANLPTDDDYSLTVTKAGYDDQTISVTITGNTDITVLMVPTP